jgi:Tup N-terminal
VKIEDGMNVVKVVYERDRYLADKEAVCPALLLVPLRVAARLSMTRRKSVIRKKERAIKKTTSRGRQPKYLLKKMATMPGHATISAAGMSHPRNSSHEQGIYSLQQTNLNSQQALGIQQTYGSPTNAIRSTTQASMTVGSPTVSANVPSIRQTATGSGLVAGGFPAAGPSTMTTSGPPMPPLSASRLLDLLDAVKHEIEVLVADLSTRKSYQEELDAKLHAQITEMLAMQKYVQDLEKAHASRDK